MSQTNCCVPWLRADEIIILHDAYGLRVRDQQALPSEVDEVVRITDEDERRFIVKISSFVAADAIRWQHELLAVLDGNPRLAAPRVCRTYADQDIVLLPDGRVLRVYEWLPGTILAKLSTHSPALLREWGAAAAELVTAFEDLHPPPGVAKPHVWELARSEESIAGAIDAIAEPAARQQIETIMGWFHDWAPGNLERLPRGVVHQDLNDFNVLAEPDEAGQMRLSGVLDFSDALETVTVAELAVAVAYAMPRRSDPLVAAMHVVAGYAARRELSEDELAAVYPLATARLCVNAAIWNLRSGQTDNEYGADRMRHTWPALERLTRVPPRLAHAALRQATGRDSVASGAELQRWLEDEDVAPVLDVALLDADLSAESHLFDGVVPGQNVAARIAEAAGGGAVAGRHLTSRFAEPVARRTRGGESSSLRLGVDIWTRAGLTVRSPCAGTIVPCEGDQVLVAHERPGAGHWWTRWRGLEVDRENGAVAAGDQIGSVRHHEEGAGCVTVAVFDDLDIAVAAPDLVPASLLETWRTVSADPSPVLGIERPASESWSLDRIVRARTEHFARSQRAYYGDPVNLVRGFGATLVDDLGRTYLDSINNVSHVGHANPAVTAAIGRQARRLNTNSRFIYDSLGRYAERLAGLLPDPLEVVFLVCTGSEANDLALRICRQISGRRNVLVIDGAYHGNTAAVTDISPNRYKRPGGSGAPETTHEVAMPDRYRGAFGYDDADAGRRYADDVAQVTARLTSADTAPAAFIAESLMGTAGNIVLPDGYLSTAFAHARAAGALCISDEVQVGFGRFGTSFWGFEDQGVVPDIVTMGKPIGNGHPMAALVTTRAVADAFDKGMKYFNTFGGNPVSCEIGLAVLDEIRDRGLQWNAEQVGVYFLDRLHELASRYEAIGDVRGRGLYLGVDLVVDGGTREPDAALAARICEQMKDEGVIVIPTGVFNNVLKIKPQMVFSRDDVDVFVGTLDRVLADRW